MAAQGRVRDRSRTKDLIDIVLIADLAVLDASTLAAASDTTFTVRATHSVPGTVPRPSADWTRPFAELAARVGVVTDIATAHAVAVGLLTPILDGSARDGVWDIEGRRWIPG